MKNTKPHTFDSLRSAAAGMRMPLWKLKWAKDQGCGAFRSNRVYEGELLRWLKVTKIPRNTSARLKEQLLASQIRKLQLANDRKQSTLINREWVVERLERGLKDVKAVAAAKTEEHTVRFPTTDPAAIAANRALIREIWDGAIAEIQGLVDQVRKGQQ